MAGYSGTPLYKKLGIKPDTRLYVRRSPVDYAALLGPAPFPVAPRSRVFRDFDLAHLFTTALKDLRECLPRTLSAMHPDGAIWVSWPKRASGVATDVTEDRIREVCLPLGLVDVKVCAVDATWSGLKLVIRKELRAERRAAREPGRA